MSKFLFLITFVFASQVFASGSFGVRGGGNTCVEQFIAYGKIIYANTKNMEYDRKAFLDKLRIADIVEVQTEMVMYEGNQYIAMNEPAANRIYLSQKWCRESRNPEIENKTAQIVFHEILGLSEPGVDKNYLVSSDLYDLTGLTEKDFYSLVITNGRERNIFKTDVYTWARANQSYPLRSYLQLAPDNLKASAVFDCSLYSSAVNSSDDSGDSTAGKPILVIMGHKSKYTFYNKMMCDNLLEYLLFHQYSNVKVSFLVGTTTMTIYDVIAE